MVTRRARHSGFALLLTLVLVVLAGLALAGMARRSLLAAWRAQNQAEQVQRQWAVRSLQTTLLGHAAGVLETAERELAQSQPEGAFQAVTQVQVGVMLADRRYDLLFTDEQSKLNVADVIRHRGESRARASLQAILPSPLPVGVDVNLKPLTGADSAKELGLNLLGSYDQIFAGAEPWLLVGDEGLARQVTCWGSGAVNLRRAPAAVVREACRGLLTNDQVDTLLAARERDPRAQMTFLLRGVNALDKDRLEQLSQRLTDASTCHGLWVVAHDRRRSWYCLAIGQSVLRPPQVRSTDPEDQEPATILQRLELAW